MVYRVGLALAAAWLIACDGDATRPIDIEGNYQLIALNGEPLPYDDEPGCCIYTAGSLVLETGQYVLAVTAQNKNNLMVFTLTELGTYSLDGSRIDFQTTGGDWQYFLWDTQVAGNTITLALGGDGPGADDQFRAVFRK